MNVLLVAAKSDSSRVPKKNFRPFFQDKSLVDLSLDMISSFNSSGIIKLLSTDKLGYKHHNPDVIYHRRTACLAKTETPICDVLINIISEYSLTENSKIFLIQPTSPFRTVSQFTSFYNKCMRIG